MNELDNLKDKSGIRKEVEFCSRFRVKGWHIRSFFAACLCEGFLVPSTHLNLHDSLPFLSGCSSG